MKIVLNGCFGGFGLSVEAIRMILDRKGVSYYEKEGRFSEVGFYETDTNEFIYLDGDIERDDPDLIATVEALGDKANGMAAQLYIEDIPSGTAYIIDEYDGNESIIYRDMDDWNIAT